MQAGQAIQGELPGRGAGIIKCKPDIGAQLFLEENQSRVKMLPWDQMVHLESCQGPTHMPTYPLCPAILTSLCLALSPEDQGLLCHNQHFIWVPCGKWIDSFPPRSHPTKEQEAGL